MSGSRQRGPGKVIRIDPEVGQTIFRAQQVLSQQRPGQRITVNEAAKVALAVASLHRVGLYQGTPHQPEPDPVDPPCVVAS